MVSPIGKLLRLTGSFLARKGDSTRAFCAKTETLLSIAKHRVCRWHLLLDNRPSPGGMARVWALTRSHFGERPLNGSAFFGPVALKIIAAWCDLSTQHPMKHNMACRVGVVKCRLPGAHMGGCSPSLSRVKRERAIIAPASAGHNAGSVPKYDKASRNLGKGRGRSCGMHVSIPGRW